jgi:nucleoside-diphosphate-sugar epimerase
MSENSLKKLFLTGKSGTIGKHFRKHSDSTFFDVTDRNDAEKWFKERNLLGATFLHLAALVGESQVSSDLKRATEVNVTGTINVAKLALQQGVERFLFASTSHIYKPSSSAIGEEYEKFPQNTYAKMKYEAENALLQIFKDDLDKLVIFRIFSILDFGTAGYTLGGKVTEAINNQKKILIKCALDRRDFLTPRNVSNAIEYGIQRDLAGGIYNICSGEPRTVKEAVEQMLVTANLPLNFFEFENKHSNSPEIFGNNSKIIKAAPGIESLLKWKLVTPQS